MCKEQEEDLGGLVGWGKSVNRRSWISRWYVRLRRWGFSLRVEKLLEDLSRTEDMNRIMFLF